MTGDDMQPGRVAGCSELVGSAVALARVFAAGGRLVVTAPGRQDHARHVAVEFIHPAITGARALPALAVAAEDLSDAAGSNDAALIIEHPERAVVPAPRTALELRVGGQDVDGQGLDGPDTALSGPRLVRWYHLLWELVQLGLEHPGITGGSASAGGDSTSFLYPFLDASETDDQALESALAESAETKHAQSDQLSEASVDQNLGSLDAAAADLASCRTVFAIGNGGSACDAARLVRLLQASGLQATCLADDPAILTALANDLGPKMIFSRQVEAAVRPDDVLVAFSTSGSSQNLLTAFDVPVAAEASVIACAGYGGGSLCDHPNVDHRLIVESSSVHRVQEAQSALVDELIVRLPGKSR